MSFYSEHWQNKLQAIQNFHVASRTFTEKYAHLLHGISLSPQ